MRPLCLALLVLVCLCASACDDDAPAGTGEGTGEGNDVGALDSGVFNPVDGGDEADAAEPETGTEDEEPPSEDEENVEELGRYEQCGFSGPSCEEPLQCVGTCQLPCDDGECPEGEDCIDLSGVGAAGICGHIVGEGEDCEAAQARFCDEGLNCNEGTCEAPEVVGADEACGGFDTQCEEGTVCVFTGFGSGFCRPTCTEPGECGDDETCAPAGFTGNACFEDCEPPDDTECSDPNYECRAPLIGGGEEACLPRFGGPAGERGFGEPCGGEDPCADGFFCPGLQGSYCTRNCDDTTPCPEEPAGATCQGFGFGPSVCAFMCPNGVGDCPEGMSCVDLFGQDVCSWQ